MRSKKGVQLTLQTIVILILLLGLLGFGFFMLIKTGKLGGELAGIAPSSSVLCAQTLGPKTPDLDKDGLKDTCDNCVCSKGCQNPEYDFTNTLQPTITNKRDDSDQDGLPDRCEDPSTIGKPEAKFHKDCAKSVKETKGRCILS